MLKGFEPRLYQETILATAALNNTLVVIPTGMGKTGIALLLAAQRLRNYPKSKVIVLAPTKPLVEQHMKTFQKHLEIDDMVLFTGHVAPEKRHRMFKDARVIFSTPQGLENDIISNKISLKDVSLMVFDEAHRASGGYSYVWIAEQYNRKASYPRILALTASPGDDIEKIHEVCDNLSIEEIEIRTDKDPDVKPYVQDVNINFVQVDLPEEFKEVKQWLDKCFKDKLKEVTQTGVMPNVNIDTFSKKEILGLQAQLQGQLASGEKDFEAMKAISLLAQATKVQHATELVESQGVASLHQYMSKLVSEARTTKVKATINLVKDSNFRMAWIKAEELYEKKIKHPKLIKLNEIMQGKVENNPEAKFIVFTQYRDSAVMIKDELNGLDKISSEIFVGQAKKSSTGLSQKKQIEMLDNFRHGKFNVLIATSVAEEGIDIPKVDFVIFYEPIPSVIRHIQRRGRTGRTEKGETVILMAKGTRDEAYRWSTHNKERRMHSVLEKLKDGLALKEKNHERTQKTLKNNFSSKKQEKTLKITADYREKGSPVIKTLFELGVNVELKQLHVADFLLSTRVGVEYKTVEDFVNSIVDGRLLQQLRNMKSAFDRPLIIVEGTEDMFSMRNIHPNAIHGMLSTIVISYGIPILQTKNAKETANLLTVITRNEELFEIPENYSMHFGKPKTVTEQQEYVIGALPDIGPGLAKSLLTKFGCVKNVINASKDDLQETEQIGGKKAEKLKEIIDKKYQGS